MGGIDKYAEYKDTGIEWFSSIPAHWEVHKLKHIADVNFSSVDKHAVDGETTIRLCNYVDVYYHDKITSDIDFMDATATQDEIKRFRIRKGDVLVTKDSEEWSDIAIPSYVESEMNDVICGYHLAHVRPIERKSVGSFLARAFSARGVNDQLRVEALGVTRFGLGNYSVNSALFPVPPTEEQEYISRFLDREMVRIDSLITMKERQIELLQEKRSAIIAHLVTQGMDPNIPMRDSGLAWLGMIPKHWEVKRLKYMSPHITVGIVVTPSKYYVDEGIPCLRSLNVRKGHIVDEELVFISEESNRLHSKSMLRAGDVVSVRTGQPGTTAVVDERYDGANCIDLIIIRQSNLFDSLFLSYVMGSNYVEGQFASGSGGAIQQHFNIETASCLLVAVPPKEEQVQIRDTLDRQIGRIQQAEDRIQMGIKKLHEYRAAVIFSAVTGKIDVRREIKS